MVLQRFNAGVDPRARVVASGEMNRTHGVDLERVAQTLLNLGHAFNDLGDADRARASLERAVDMFGRVYGADHAKIAEIWLITGQAFIEAGDANRARALLERALAIEERTYGAGHGITSKTRADFAVCLKALNLIEYASREMTQAANGLENAFGADHRSRKNACGRRV